METLTVNKSAMKKYIVLRDFTIGQADLPVRQGDELWYTKGMLEIYGQTYRVNNLHVAYKMTKEGQAWITLAEGQEPDPVMERLAGRDSYVPRPATAKNATASRVTAPQPVAPVIEEGVEAVNGVEVLPTNWAELHWTHKRAYVIKLRDVSLLHEIMDEESDKMKTIIKNRIQQLAEENVSPKLTNTISISSDSVGRDYGTPVNIQKPKQVTTEDKYIQTSFGDTTEYIDMTKSPKGKSASDESFDVSVTEDTDSFAEVAFDT